MWWVRSSDRFFLVCIIIEFLELKSIMPNLEAEIDIRTRTHGNEARLFTRGREALWEIYRRKACIIEQLRLLIAARLCKFGSFSLFLFPGCLTVFRCCKTLMALEIQLHTLVTFFDLCEHEMKALYLLWYKT